MPLDMAAVERNLARTYTYASAMEHFGEYEPFAVDPVLYIGRNRDGGVRYFWQNPNSGELVLCDMADLRAAFLAENPIRPA